MEKLHTLLRRRSHLSVPGIAVPGAQPRQYVPGRGALLPAHRPTEPGGAKAALAGQGGVLEGQFQALALAHDFLAPDGKSHLRRTDIQSLHDNEGRTLSPRIKPLDYENKGMAA